MSFNYIIIRAQFLTFYIVFLTMSTTEIFLSAAVVSNIYCIAVEFRLLIRVAFRFLTKHCVSSMFFGSVARRLYPSCTKASFSDRDAQQLFATFPPKMSSYSIWIHPFKNGSRYTLEWVKDFGNKHTKTVKQIFDRPYSVSVKQDKVTKSTTRTRITTFKS